MPDQNNNNPAEKLDLVVFKLDQEEYAASVKDVKEVIKSPKINPIPSSPDYVLGFMNLRGTVVSVIDMEKKFGLERSNEGFGNMVMIVDAQDSPFGVMVDEVTEVISVSGGEIQKTPKNLLQKIGEKYLEGIALVNVDTADENHKSKASEKDSTDDKNTDKITSLSDAVEKRALLLVNLKELLSENNP